MKNLLVKGKPRPYHDTASQVLRLTVGATLERGYLSTNTIFSHCSIASLKFYA